MRKIEIEKCQKGIIFLLASPLLEYDQVKAAYVRNNAGTDIANNWDFQIAHQGQGVFADHASILLQLRDKILWHRAGYSRVGVDTARTANQWLLEQKKFVDRKSVFLSYLQKFWQIPLCLGRFPLSTNCRFSLQNYLPNTFLWSISWSDNANRNIFDSLSEK